MVKIFLGTMSIASLNMAATIADSGLKSGAVVATAIGVTAFAIMLISAKAQKA
jgi:hypothetical protein